MRGKMVQRHLIVGSWKLENGKVVEDDACAEIRKIIREHFEEVAQDQSGWFKLYREVATGNYWELDFPQSGNHGGGPPRLRRIKLVDTQGRYGTIDI
jgi:hypothetical protein